MVVLTAAVGERILSLVGDLAATERARTAATSLGDRGETRDVLLDAALAVFTERTYGDTPVALVAERAGVSVGTLYRYFPSKEALGNAVYRQWKSRLFEPLTRGDDEPRTAHEEFTQIWDVLRLFATERPNAFAFLEFQQHESYLDDESRALSASVDAASADFVVRGQRSGEIRSGDATMLVALVFGAFVGLGKVIRAGLVLDDGQLAAAKEAAWELLRSP